MPLYIRDDNVDELAKAVQAASGAKDKTEAVRVALRNELARLKAKVSMRDKISALQQRAAERLPASIEGVDTKKLFDDMWDQGE